MHPDRPGTMTGALTVTERRCKARLCGVSWPRPRKRSECRNDPRPCPFVGCRYHLLCDVTVTGAVSLAWSVEELFRMPETCALDVAERGGCTLEEIGRLLRITRERARQISAEAARKIRRSGVDLEDVPEVRRHALAEVQDFAPGDPGLSGWRNAGGTAVGDVTMHDVIRASVFQARGRSVRAAGGSR